MNRRVVDDAVSGANPIDLTEASLPPLSDTEREFLAGVMAEPQEPNARTRRARRPRRGFAAPAMTLGAIGAGALAFLLIGNSGSGPAGPPESAYAAELARIAEGGSELVIVEPPEKSYLKPIPGPPAKSDDGWVIATAVWDCTELPCIRKNIEEAQREGLIPGGVHRRQLPRDAELVVPPSAGN